MLNFKILSLTWSYSAKTKLGAKTHMTNYVYLQLLRNTQFT